MSSCVLRLLQVWMQNIADSTCRKQEKLRRPTLHVIIIHCRKKRARVAPPKTLTDSYTQILPKNSNLTSIQWFGHPNSYYTILHYRSIPCLKTLVHRVHYSFTACFFTLLSYTQYFYIAELYSIRTQCWGMLSLNNLLSNSQFQYVAELWPILSHCWSIHNIATLLSYNLP